MTIVIHFFSPPPITRRVQFTFTFYTVYISIRVYVGIYYNYIIDIYSEYSNRYTYAFQLQSRLQTDVGAAMYYLLRAAGRGGGGGLTGAGRGKGCVLVEQISVVSERGTYYS